MPELPEPKVRPHPNLIPSDADRAAARLLAMEPYAELQVTSNFTFLTGASHPDELVQQAAMLGYRAIAITDKNSLAGVVRAHVAAKEISIPIAIGCRLEIQSQIRRPSHFSGEPFSAPTPAPLSILVYPTSRTAYGRLCRLLTLGKRRAEKGECHLALHDVLDHHQGLLAVVVPPAILDQHFIETLQGMRRCFDDDRLSLAVSRLYTADDETRVAQLHALSLHTNVPLVVTNDVHYHAPQRRALQDVITCIRHGCTIDEAGFRLFANAERHLKSPREIACAFASHFWATQAIERSVEIALRAAHGFSLDELRYEYPDEVVPPGKTPMQHLVDLTWAGAGKRYPKLRGGIPNKVRAQIEHEFQLIDELNYAPYFLTVHDLVVYARSRGILCQGRGAAANSAVCYCLGVTAVDPDRIDLLFERFVSKERNEPPDIDIDFEHERREEVIQYIYQKYGRDRAALTAEVITYRGRSAVREVGKALGLSLDCVDRLAKNIDWWSSGVAGEERLRELGVNPDDPTMKRLVALADELLGFPRHLSQHVGGFVMTRGLLCESVPIENAAMEERTVIEWDKDDIEALGMLKVDVLGLGMLTCIRKAFELVNKSDGATKRWSDEGRTNFNEENSDGADSDISRFDRVAEEHGTGANDLSRYIPDANIGAICPHQSDETCGSFDSIEYRRGTCETESFGLSETSEDRSGIIGGAFNAIRTCNEPSQHDSLSEECERPVDRMRPHSPGIDSKSRKEEVTTTPSSLRRSVAPSLPLELHTIPPEDPAVYDMICAADTIGVFQIESRAQMSMLPRLRPRSFYDLVIEVAIVRPGPIQGNMVHPYLRRRNGEEKVTFPDDKVRKVLEKTLGVPLFQEQAMSLAIVAAGFTPGEADQLRRAIAAWKTRGNKIEQFGVRIVKGMTERGYPREFAERCFEQIKGFSGYGFPESHAASFALLVYVSAWLKKHHPAEFAAALINSQPMGFYLPAQLVRDAREHGVEVRPIDVNCSAWDCGMEWESDGATERRSDEGEGKEMERRRDEEMERRSGDGKATERRSNEGDDRLREAARRGGSSTCGGALRLGMRLIKGLSQVDADAIAAAVKAHGPFDSIDALHRASGVRVRVLRRLAYADAFGSMGLDRQTAMWQVRALRDEKLPMFDQREVPSSGFGVQSLINQSNDFSELGTENSELNLPHVQPLRKVAHDYASTGLSLRPHPISFIRERLNAMRVTPTGELKDQSRWRQGMSIAVVGIVLVRQRPSTANGIVFMTMEDETGVANLIIRPQIYKKFRKAARHAVVLLARGRVERQGDVVHVVAQSMEEIDLHEATIESRSRDFH